MIVFVAERECFCRLERGAWTRELVTKREVMRHSAGDSKKAPRRDGVQKTASWKKSPGDCSYVAFMNTREFEI